MPIELPKGVRDFPPEEKMLRQEILDKMRIVFERFGYAPLETPTFERLDVLNAKFAAGEGSDVLKETFTFTDQGQRKLGLRFDLTVPLARFVTMHPELKFPFKRYQIDRAYRDGPIRLGRYREFWQCDVDIVGTDAMLADAEILAIAQAVFKELGLSVTLEVSNRKFLEGILTQAGLTQNKHNAAMIVIDKFKKLTRKELEQEFAQRDIDEEAIVKIMALLGMNGTNEEILNQMAQFSKTSIGQEGVKELSQIFTFLKGFGMTNAIVSPSLARGLSYYTGPVFEGFLDDGEDLGISSSVCGGGRYDDMIGSYVGDGRKIPASGISFGLEPITEALKKKGKAQRKTPTQAYIIPVGITDTGIAVATALRNAGICTDMDLQGRGISKNLAYANALAIPFVIIVGEDEIAAGKVKLRDMKTGKEGLENLKDAIKKIKRP
ncbi:MAG: histidine--tRNA ligase [Nanoarchaeota archaeon]